MGPDSRWFCDDLLERLRTVIPQQRLNEVLPLLGGQDVNQVPVMETGRLVGVGSREDVVRFLEIRRGLRPEGGAR